MINDDLALRDLSEVADAIAAGRITSVQATEACLARIADPPVMFSVVGITASTLQRDLRRFSPDMTATTAAAPAMSVFMSSMPAIGFSARPPESNVTPFPTRAMVSVGDSGVYVRWINRGG